MRFVAGNKKGPHLASLPVNPAKSQAFIFNGSGSIFAALRAIRKNASTRLRASSRTSQMVARF
jgi:hypothetical protein